jgi:CRISPR/Cas system CSM-associated protein Csm3 (group 7 of RAMP superfamily)
MIKRQSFHMSIAVRSPFSFADVDGAGIGIDTPALRDAQKTPLLPADHLKGLMREAYRALPQTVRSTLPHCDENKLFGTAASGPMNPNRGQLLFADLKQHEASAGKHSITRIKIDEDTGTVEAGMLQVVELVAPLNAVCDFKGNLIWHGTDADAATLRIVLTKALHLIPYFGGMRSIGYGEHETGQSRISPPVASALRSPTAPHGKAFTVKAHFDRPIAVDVEQVADNVFKGGSVVPGSALKGALANMLELSHGAPLPKALADTLTATRISHAFPTRDGGMLDQALPFSVVLFDQKDNSHRNELGREDPGYDAQSKTCGLFLPDMKPEQENKLAKKLNRLPSNFKTYALGHTAIDRNLGSAENGKLHVLLALDTQENSYSFTINLPDEGPEARTILETLAAGLDSVGKSNARLSCVPIADPKGATSSSSPPPDRLRILLETPTPLVIPHPQSHDTLDQLLPRYFNLHGLELEDAFIRHVIKGGYAARSTGAAYRPVRLIKAGSCFQFKPTQQAFDTLQNLLETGLPLMAQKADGSLVPQPDWRDCVFQPQNGFGAFSLNPAALEDI